MKTKSLYFILIVCSIAFFSCSELEQVEIEKETNSSLDKIDFENLEVGDVMLYSYLQGESCWIEGDCDLTYTGDTLELKVIGQINGKFVIQESITPGSAIFSSETKYILGEIEEKYDLLWHIRSDSLFVTSLDPSNIEFQSHLLRYPPKLTLNDITENKVEFRGWQTTLSPDVGLADFFIEDGELLDITYPHLNGYLNYAAMAFDNDGSTFIYNKENGFVRVTATSAWTLQGHGWDRIN